MRQLRTRLWQGSTLAVLAHLLALPAAAQEPNVAALLEEHRQAMGGDALEKVRSLRLEGVYAYNGLEHPLIELRSRPGRLRREIDGIQQWGPQRAAGKMVVRSCDNGKAWVMGEGDASESGHAAMEDDLAGSFIDDADFPSPLVDAEAKGHRVTLVGREDLDGRDTHHLRVTLASGRVEDWWLDAASHLPVRRAIAPTEHYARPHTWYFDDWREVAGIRVAFYVMAEEEIFSREYVYERAEANVEIDPDVFRPAGESGSLSTQSTTES